MTIIDYLEYSAKKHPYKTVFFDQEKGISYQELLACAERIATALLLRTGTVNEPVAVLIDRNVESICAFMGIAMSRNFYVPIDVSQPQKRIRVILDQMEPAALISFGNSPEQFGETGIPVLSYDDLLGCEPDRQLLHKVRSTCLDIDPLYAICTSGSTGVPKGVLISHRSVMDFIPVFCETFALNEEEVFGNQAPFDFDVSVKDIYATLYCGASMYIIPKVCFAMPKLLVTALDRQRVTTIIWAVSALCIAAGVNAFKNTVPGSLHKILFSGEVMPVKMLNVWRAYFPDAMFVNLYGPTEITCNCLYYILDREFENTEKLPLGTAFANEGVLFLNEQNQPISPGETGEICVVGTSLALGYYKDPQKTAEAFVQNPCNDKYPQIMYRTGDLAYLAENGEYYFAARKDFQIKHMGHRIELEEIESFLNAAEGVIRAACLFDGNRNKIVACYEGSVDQAEIIGSLKMNLPKYMIPNRFIRMEHLPVSKNGKIDRQRLMELYIS